MVTPQAEPHRWHIKRRSKSAGAHLSSMNDTHGSLCLHTSIYPTFQINTRVTAGLTINTEINKTKANYHLHRALFSSFICSLPGPACFGVSCDELRCKKESILEWKMTCNQVSNVSNEHEFTLTDSSSPFPYPQSSTTSDNGAICKLSLGYWGTGFDGGNIPGPESSGPSLFPSAQGHNAFNSLILFSEVRGQRPGVARPLSPQMWAASF